MTRTRAAKAAARRNLREIVARLAVERLLSETTILRVTLDFIGERGIEAECASYLERRSR